MSLNCTFAEIGDLLRSRWRFVVMSHFRPDGDAFGARFFGGGSRSHTLHNGIGDGHLQLIAHEFRVS